jgi:PPIC-type peptidyl-prolyl cis-trans isomerase-like protein
VHRRAIWIGCLFAALATIIVAPLRGQVELPTADFVILKGDDLTSSSVRLTIIVVGTRADAQAVRRKLESGASFEALARQYSNHPSGAVGGDFGIFPIADLPADFRTALNGLKSGGYTQPVAIQKPTVPPEWPQGVPLPGASLKSVELMLGRSYTVATMPADGGSTMTELTYPFGVRLRIHESRGLGFMEFTPPWKSSIFRIRPDDQLPAVVLDALPRTGRFIRGVFASVPGHPNWFIDVDDRVDAVSRVLFVDRNIYGNLPGIPKS